jgi:DNA-binding transcriptional regulator/RsmH inhibitor MraZ
MAGQDDRIEIWDKTVYDSQEMPEDDFAGLAEKLLGEDLNNVE